MMSHYEGQIVNSFYDCFLISWWSHPFTPPLPCLKDRVLADDNRNKSNFQFGDDSPTTKFIKNQTLYAVARARQILQNHTNLDETEFIYEHDKLENVSKAEKAKEFHKVVEQVMRVHKALQQEKESPLTQHFNSVSKYPCAMSSEISSPDLELLAIDFCPFIFHQPHEPFPIALVNRLPSGTPGHESKQVPQNAAWLGAFKYAQRNIFIQSPTLNASSAIKAILEACRRGIKVELYLDLGFNDLAEGYFPFQGGTNEHVVRSLFKELKKDRKDDVVNNLAVYWYVGKDQTYPLNAAQKQRNCHIKFMSIDDEVAIMGNGNMDTQSWFHSQEINAMIDSKEVVAEWMDAIRKNQSTGVFGNVIAFGDDSIKLEWRGIHADEEMKKNCIY